MHYDHYNGVTENILYQGSLIAKANPDRSKSSHCVGLTYEVFFKAMQERNKETGISTDNFNNMTINNMRDCMLTWYDAEGTPSQKGTSWQEQLSNMDLEIKSLDLRMPKQEILLILAEQNQDILLYLLIG